MISICLNCKRKYHAKKSMQKYCCMQCYLESCGNTEKVETDVAILKEERDRKKKEREALKRRRRNSVQSLNEIARKAREAGMTYGQYVAKMERL